MRNDLIDSDGENRAVRAFLSLYGTSPTSMLGTYARHMECLGWDMHPPFVDQDPHAIMTKAGAQIWIRFLFSLENENE